MGKVAKLIRASDSDRDDAEEYASTEVENLAAGVVCHNGDTAGIESRARAVRRWPAG